MGRKELDFGMKIEAAISKKETFIKICAGDEVRDYERNIDSLVYTQMALCVGEEKARGCHSGSCCRSICDYSQTLSQRSKPQNSSYSGSRRYGRFETHNRKLYVELSSLRDYT